MNHDDIIRMASAAGWDDYTLLAIAGTEQMDRLQAFARLIAEDCAKRCEARAEPLNPWIHEVDAEAHACAAAIREAYKP